MDDFISTFIRITIIILLVRTVVSLITSFVVTRKMRKAQQDTRQNPEQSSAPLNRDSLEQTRREQLMSMELEGFREKKEETANRTVRDLVKDDYCGKLIEKTKSYIIRDHEQYRHFCSWECRRNYIEAMGSEG